MPVPVPYANLTNPQTLNLYSMVADDPESFADLGGHVENVAMGNPSYGQPSCDLTGGGASSAAATSGKCDANASAEQANDQNTQTESNKSAQNLSAADVTKIVQQAQKSATDPATTAINIFNGLGNNVTVSG